MPKKKKGFILLISVLIVGMVALTIGVFLLLSGVDSSRSVMTQEQSSLAKYLADACAEEALQQIHDNTSFDGTGNLNFGQGTCGYTVVKQTGQSRIITSTGEIGTTIRKVKLTLDKITPTISIVSWQEVADF